MEDRWRVASREFYTFAYLLHIGERLAKAASEKSIGLLYTRVPAVVFSAFAVEACLNHLGEELPTWEIVEPKLSWRQKLQFIAANCGFKVDFGSIPFQTVSECFALRDKIAHGKTFRFEGMIDINSESTPDWLAKWVTPEKVKIALRDARAAIVFLLESCGKHRQEASLFSKTTSLKKRSGTKQ